MIAKCPHCKKEINPASILGKESAKKRNTSSEAMRKLANKRWNTNSNEDLEVDSAVEQSNL